MPEESSRVTLRPAGEMPGSADGSRMRTLYYDILADSRKVGTCELRPETTWTTPLSGQVAYTVFPTCRGHRYALSALRLLCEQASGMGLHSLTVTCRPENRASRRTLELAGAALKAIEFVPPEHPLYSSDVREVCVYRLEWE